MAISHFVASDDASIHYLDAGGADGRAPIVFVPGMTDVAEDYLEIAPLFGRRTIVVDLRGHGRSTAPASGYDLAALGRDVGAVVDAVTDGPVHLATFSRGTTYALGWAVEHPHRVLSLSIGDYVPEEKVLTEAQSRPLLEGRWRGTPVRTRLDRQAAEATFRAARARSFWESLSRIEPPLLVVRARNSPIVTDADWVRYAQLFPGATLVEFEDSPHDVFRPDRGRYPRLIRDHVDRADEPSAHE
jgi:pimeloyl-ACP methyl ester carboxylesterase